MGWKSGNCGGSDRINSASAALVELGRALKDAGYAFVTPTPLTHSRVNARPGNEVARSLRDFFGWSRPAPIELLPLPLLELARDAAILDHRGPLVASRVRFATLNGLCFVHSAYPTLAPDSVFFGPDTYRFAAVVERAIATMPRPPLSILDLGCGSGAGGIVAALAAGDRPRLLLSDINPSALWLARVNAAIAGVDAQVVAADLCAAFDGCPAGYFDLIVANPPYLVDPARRLYRDGGGAFGAALSLRILREGLARLAPGGRLVLYTGSAIVDGQDALRERATQLASAAGCQFEYTEIDPDVFGEELETTIYQGVERIAVVSLVVLARA